MKTLKRFDPLYVQLGLDLIDAPIVKTTRWQSTDANPNALQMHELEDVYFHYQIPRSMKTLSDDVKPFLPWATKHFFLERVSGEPINPGTTYKEWRYPASAEEHTVESFSHSYAERYWPKYAAQTSGGLLTVDTLPPPNVGLREELGDLNDLVHLLAEDPYTRQAYLPIYFPEDLTAARKKERIPCTLGYHFMMRDGELDVFYPMRSCDYVRHLQDDVYLTCMLAYWVLAEAKQIATGENAEIWSAVEVGKLKMHISSLHCFRADAYNLKKGANQ